MYYLFGKSMKKRFFNNETILIISSDRHNTVNGNFFDENSDLARWVDGPSSPYLTVFLTTLANRPPETLRVQYIGIYCTDVRLTRTVTRFTRGRSSVWTLIALKRRSDRVRCVHFAHERTRESIPDGWRLVPVRRRWYRNQQRNIGFPPRP